MCTNWIFVFLITILSLYFVSYFDESEIWLKLLSKGFLILSLIVRNKGFMNIVFILKY